MRHSIYGKKLSRDTNQRTALFKSLIQSLILSEKIETTNAKAQAIKGLVDRLVTQAKTPNTRRLVSQFLTNKRVYNKLVELTPRMQTRNSGYTSIIKTGFRQGDGSMMVQMKLLLEEPKKLTKAEEVETSVKSAEKEIPTQVLESRVKTSQATVKRSKSVKSAGKKVAK